MGKRKITTYAFEGGLSIAMKKVESAREELESMIEFAVGDEQDRLQKMIDELESIGNRLLNFEYNTEDY